MVEKQQGPWAGDSAGEGYAGSFGSGQRTAQAVTRGLASSLGWYVQRAEGQCGCGCGQGSGVGVGLSGSEDGSGLWFQGQEALEAGVYREGIFFFSFLF